jgi:3-oxoacyl-[acyl-carrier protein] reductase
MDLGLQGKRALVLSSSRGLGRGVAESLAAEGAEVMLTARSADRLQATADAIDAKGKGRAHAFAADLKGETEAIHQAAVDALGGVDILVANTGGPPARTALNVEPDAWTPQFEAMVVPIFKLAGLVLPGMLERRWGRILIIASSGVVQPIPNLVISNALRASLVGWSKTLASEVAKDGVTVNLVLPGRIEPTVSENWTPSTPRRRVGRPKMSPPLPAPQSQLGVTVASRSSQRSCVFWPPSGRATSQAA